MGSALAFQAIIGFLSIRRIDKILNRPGLLAALMHMGNRNRHLVSHTDTGVIGRAKALPLYAGIAQWQSRRFVIVRLQVRLLLPAPCQDNQRCFYFFPGRVFDFYLCPVFSFSFMVIICFLVILTFSFFCLRVSIQAAACPPRRETRRR